MKKFFKTYSHCWVFLYAFIYIFSFFAIESLSSRDFYWIHCPLDDYIPFVEYFIIPYILWFPYMLAVFLLLFFKDTKGFYRSAIFFVTGMSLFLIISALWANGHQLRPEAFERNNIFTYLVSLIYKADTSTNIFPSIHVYNSIGAHLSLLRYEPLKAHPWVLRLSFVLMCSIILSTVFLKQHSVIDVLGGFVLALFMWWFVYRSKFLARL